MSEIRPVRRFEGRVAIVTGGGGGIGKAIARGFAAEGANVALLEIDEAKGSATAQELASVSGSQVIAVPCDVADDDGVREAVSQVVDRLGAPTLLVNNAATFAFGPIEEITPEVWHKSLAVNVVGQALMVRHALAPMREAGGGTIVNIGSVSSWRAQPEFLPYSATKAAILQITRCLALDLAKDNIRVNCVCPGAVWSETVQRNAQEQGITREEYAQQPNYGREQIQVRIADVDEIAAAVLFLASEESTFITGTSLMVDGGWTAR